MITINHMLPDRTVLCVDYEYDGKEATVDRLVVVDPSGHSSDATALLSEIDGMNDYLMAIGNKSTELQMHVNYVDSGQAARDVELDWKIRERKEAE